MRKVKIVFTIDSLVNDGTEKSVLETISRFSVYANCSVVYFSPRHNLKNEFEKYSIPLHFLYCSKPFFFLKGVYKFYRFVSVSKPDIVVSSLFSANLISRIVCFLTRTKLVGTFVSDSYSKIRLDSFTIKQKFGFHLVYLLDRATSFIPQIWIANSESIKKSNCLKLNISEEKVCVIYRGRDSKKFILKPEYKQEDCFQFITLGRLYFSKGIFDLLQAFKKLTIEFPQVCIHIYGDGPERKNIEKFIVLEQLEKQVILHGNTSDAWKFIYSSNCFVFPSHNEGFSGALIEAMMCGIPIIASDIPMNLEAVEHEKTALIFKVKSVEELYLNMKRMIQRYSEMLEMGVRAREIAMNRFDIESISKLYEQKLLSLIK